MVQSDYVWHCKVCGTCSDWNSWHCFRCKKCTYGVLMPCEGCGGVTEMFNWQRREEIRSQSGDASRSPAMYVEGVCGHVSVGCIEAFVELSWTFVVQESLVTLAHSERLLWERWLDRPRVCSADLLFPFPFYYLSRKPRKQAYGIRPNAKKSE